MENVASKLNIITYTTVADNYIPDIGRLALTEKCLILARNVNMLYFEGNIKI